MAPDSARCAYCYRIAELAALYLALSEATAGRVSLPVAFPRR